MASPLQPIRVAALVAGLVASGFAAERVVDLRDDAPAADARSGGEGVEAVPAPGIGPSAHATRPPGTRLPGTRPAGTRPISLGARLPMGPVQGPVSSPFGRRRHPVSGRVRHHDGVDLAVPAGTAVWAVAPGRVRAVGRRGGYGLVVEIDHPAGLGRPVRTLYAHLSAVDAALRRGSQVARGQALGASGGRPGRDGVSTGAHLHFEVLDAAGEPLDPGRFVRLLDALRSSDGAPRRWAPRRLAPRTFARRVVSASGHEGGAPVEASSAPRDAVDIWPAAAPGLPQAERLPDLVLPDYPVSPGSAARPSGHAPVTFATSDPS